MSGFADEVTPVVLAGDEERNIARTFGQLGWAREVVLCDSFSSDRTIEIAEAFIREIRSLEPSREVDAYEASFIYAIGGRPLRTSLYPPRAVLLRKGGFDIYMDGHCQRIRINGVVERLNTRIIHDDRKSFRRFLSRQRKYMREEAAKLRTADPRTLNPASRIRKLRVVAPLVIIPYTLIVKGLILDGIAGLHYAFERFVAESMLSMELFRRR